MTKAEADQVLEVVSRADEAAMQTEYRGCCCDLSCGSVCGVHAEAAVLFHSLTELKTLIERMSDGHQKVFLMHERGSGSQSVAWPTNDV
jgi:hypothetical protein